MKVIVVYDDTGRKSEMIADIIGEKGFAEVVVKKKCIEDYYYDHMLAVFPDMIWKKIRSIYEYTDLIKELEGYVSQECRVLHAFSNYVISDEKTASLSFEKLEFIDEAFAMMDGLKAVAAMFPDLAVYLRFCRGIISGQKPWDLIRGFDKSFAVEGIIDIGVISNFIQCITGNFDSRYFNSLNGDEYTIVKSSGNKRKIRAEYDFYHLLPDDMKYWFVLPFNYQEDDEKASYTMERLHMTDLAIKWVHGSMDLSEFNMLLDKYFFFFRSRHGRKCTRKRYDELADSLYLVKVRERIKLLKSLPEYGKLSVFLSVSNEFDIDSLFDKYLMLKKRIEERNEYECFEVIGHGDPCFANTLYNKSTQTLKFIDPKGASREDELWTNPYYDIAKLSHSVCGLYDFFNNGLYDIQVTEDFSYHLDIPFDNSKFVEVFKKKTEENGFDYLTVRIYEASLFLSMLPLHIDNPHKVFGFILNVKNILEEIEKNV